jgi:hypothetical protein
MLNAPPTLRQGAPVRWLGRDGIVLNVYETDVEGERVFSVDLGLGVVAIALERDLRNRLATY